MTTQLNKNSTVMKNVGQSVLECIMWKSGNTLAWDSVVHKNLIPLNKQHKFIPGMQGSLTEITMKERQTSFHLPIALPAEPYANWTFWVHGATVPSYFSHFTQGKKTLQVTHLVLLLLITLTITFKYCIWVIPTQSVTWGLEKEFP